MSQNNRRSGAGRLRHELDAYRVYLIFQAANAFLSALVLTIYLVYHVTVVGMNPLQLVLVGTAFEVTVFLFEVPTGVVADVYSRRFSVIVGVFLIGLGLMLEGSIPLFVPILLAQLPVGLGDTFISGALSAWIADEIGEEQAGRAYLRGGQVAQLASIAGIVASVALASIYLALPIVLSGVLFVALALFLVVVMPENGFRPVPVEQRSSWRSLTHTFRAGTLEVQRRPILLTILGINVVFGMFSEGLDRLWTAHLLDNFTLPGLGALPPIVWFGVTAIVGMLGGAVLTEIAQRRIDTQAHQPVARALLVINALLVASSILFALAGHFMLALAAYWMTGSLRSLVEPLYTAWINQGLDSKVRATGLSMSAQVHAFGEIAGGPAIGVIGNLFGVRAALALGSMILSPVLLLYARTLTRPLARLSP